MYRYSSNLWLHLLFSVLPLFAADNDLNPQQSALLDSVVSSFKIEHCCGTSLKSCLNKSTCPIVSRLYDFSLWLVQRESDRTKILEQLEKRYEGFVTNEKHVIDTSFLAWAGSPSSPVRIVSYISSGCNMCKRIVGELYDSVTVGSLSGKAKLLAIPIGTGPGDLALLIANSKGKFWELFQKFRENKLRYSDEDVVKMAEETGISGKEMRYLLKNQGFKNLLSAARNQSTAKEVKVTPTFFINEKRYSSYKDPQWVIDAALFEIEKGSLNK